MYRFGRAYPTYWREDNFGGHCLAHAAWLARDGSVLAVSDYEQRDRFLSFVGQHRAPYFASHWQFLLKPLVPDHGTGKGLIRYRQIEYSRMPLLAYLAMDNVRAVARADVVRLGLVTAPGASDALPYSAHYVRDFETRYCYDQFWNEERTGRPGTRFMACGHAFVMVGDANDAFFIDSDAGLLGQFRHHMRKGNGEGWDSFRGSGAFQAAVDILMRIERKGEAFRELHAEGRFAALPRTVTYELDENGAFQVATIATERDRILAALEAAGSATREQLAETVSLTAR